MVAREMMQIIASRTTDRHTTDRPGA